MQNELKICITKTIRILMRRKKMRLKKLIQKKGIKEILMITLRHLFFPINKLIFMCFRMLPINNHVLVFESEGDFSDNAYAFYEYVKDNSKKDVYKYVWLVDDLKKCKKYKTSNTVVVKKRPARIALVADYYLAVCKFYIYDHTNILGMYGKRKEQKIINLWHGCSFKKTTASASDKGINSEDIMTVTGDFWKDIMSEFVCCDNRKSVSLGYPRNDYLFTNNHLLEKWKKKYKTETYKKIFFWMPTFRQSKIMSISEDYYDGETGLPIFLSIDELELLNKFLHEYNSLLLFKVHHLQLDYPAFKKNYSNIKIVTDREINNNGLQLYQVIGVSDALITDYSAIFNDYLLLNRPMIFTLDDYKQYKESRGFSIDNPLEYYPGFHVYNQEEFYKAIKDILEDRDPYIEHRNKIRLLMHKYVDGNSCKRISDYIGIKTGGNK